MANPTITPGQGPFTPGISPTARIMVDSTKSADTSQIAAGFPAALDVSTGLVSGSAASGDLSYGVFSSDINVLYGRTSLGEFSAVRPNCELQGRYTIRQAVYQDSSGNELTAYPVTDATSAADAWATVAVGDSFDAIITTSTITGDAFNGYAMLRWVIGGGSTGNGFNDVATVVAKSDDGSEIEIVLNGGTIAYAAIS